LSRASRTKPGVPVIGHLEGLCHTYIHEKADPAKAEAIIVNAKLRRVGVCGSTETMLIDASVAPHCCPASPVRSRPPVANCAATIAHAPSDPMKAATLEDWTTEYLAPILSIAVVDGLDAAMDHIARYGLATHGKHRHRRRCSGGTIPRRGRQRHRHAQRIDSIC